MRKINWFFVKNSNLLTIISSPTPVARQSEPATRVAIFSWGSVIIGRPAHKTSVPVVWPLHSGLFIQHNVKVLQRQVKISNSLWQVMSKCARLRVKKEVRQSTTSDMLIFGSNFCKYYLVCPYSFWTCICQNWRVKHRQAHKSTREDRGGILHARNLISPAAGNLNSHKALFGTRLRILHLSLKKKRRTWDYAETDTIDEQDRCVSYI